MNKIEVEIIIKLKEYVQMYGPEKTCEDFESKIIRCNNNILSSWFVENIEGADVKAHAKVILDSKDACDNYWFAYLVDGADVKAHGKVVIDSGDVHYNYRFAHDVEGADVEAHKRVIIDSGNEYYNNMITKYIDELNAENEEENLVYNYIFQRKVNNTNEKAYQKVL